MPGIVRQSDLCSGHGGWPPRPPKSFSNNVKANSASVVRLGDGWITHCLGTNCHDGSQSTASPNVTANGRKIARIGDNISCGSKNAGGSPNVKVNG